MKVIIEFETDNASFADDLPGEVDRVLDDVAARLAARLNMPDRITADSGRVSDSNGNTIGKWRFEEL